MKRAVFFAMLLLCVSVISHAQFKNKQDVFDYLEGKTFIYNGDLTASFHNGMISLDWDANYKCKLNVYWFSANKASLDGTIRIGYVRGDLLYNLKMELDKSENKFTLVGGPEDGTYTLAPPTDTPRPNSFDSNVYEMGQVDKIATFPNGETSMNMWISKNVRYPHLAAERGEAGRVVVSLIVDKDGSITYPKIKESVSQSLDTEAIRVIKNMPKWTPAVKNGKTIRMSRVVSINFGSGSSTRLAEEKKIADQKAAEEKARQEELERQRVELEKQKAEEERIRLEQLRTEAYANDPIIKALSIFESKESISDIFDYKIYYEVPNVTGVPQKRGVLLFFNANKKTKEVYEEYKEMVGHRTKPNDAYRQFVEEKFNEVLPNIISCLSNLSIVDADGHTYSFKLVETLPKGLEQKSWLKHEIIGMPSYSSCILRANLDENAVENLNIGTVNLGKIPFLQKEHHKGDKLYYCDFQLPFSSSYSIIVNGKTIKGERVDYSEFYQLKQGKNMTEIIVRSSADMRRNTQQNNNRQRQIYRR